MFDRLKQRKSLVVVGLNSGTSADGVDLAAIRVGCSKESLTVKFLDGVTFSYTTELKDEIEQGMTNRLSLDDTILLDRKLGHYFGKKAGQFINRLNKKNIKPNLLASHGQTIRHLPGRMNVSGRTESATLQIGHPETISILAGLPIVADLRQSDIAAGGEGAPITTLAMYELFKSKSENRLLVNVGGISNYFYFPKIQKNGKKSKILARDCGPGNSLIDLAARELFKLPYDRGGKLALAGKPSMRLLSLLLSDSFLKGKHGPSTGKERFGEKFYRRARTLAKKLKINKSDFMATLTELTGVAILNGVKSILDDYELKNIYIFGGGKYNKYLTTMLKSNLDDVELKSVEKLGYDSRYLEAASYALMGAMAVYRINNVYPGATGAKKATVGGRLICP